MRPDVNHERKMRRSASSDAPNPVGYSGDKERLMNHISLREIVDDQDARTLGSLILVIVEPGVHRHSQPRSTASRCVGSTGLER